MHESYDDTDFSPAIGALTMENRELRQLVDTRAALAEQALEELHDAYRALVRCEVAIKRSRGV